MTVVREGVEKKVHYNYIYTGDVIKIRAGMNIPVDGIIIRSSGVSANESAMTGETLELAKESLHVCLKRQEEKEEEL